MPPRRESITWTCHICGQERPDEFISVQKNTRRLNGTTHKVIENVRYCNDKAECASAAPKFSFQPKQKRPTKGAALAQRDRRPVGE